MEWMYIRCHFARGQSRFANFDKIVRVHGGTRLFIPTLEMRSITFVSSCRVLCFVNRVTSLTVLDFLAATFVLSFNF